MVDRFPDPIDSVRDYLREISKIPRLTDEQVLAYLGDVQVWKAEQEKSRPDPLIVARGKRAKTHLVESNLRLAFSIAKRYVNRGLPLGDLINEANIGLMRVPEKFDLNEINPKTSEPYKFSTYATWWIKQSISRALSDQRSEIRKPAHMVERVMRVMRAYRNLPTEIGHEPSVKEVAEHLGIAEGDVLEALRHNEEPVSLDEPIGDDDLTRGDTIEDTRGSSPTENIDRMAMQADVAEVFTILTDEERRILQLRFGFDGNPMTLEEVGSEQLQTRERVRQKEERAMRKLRHPARANILR